MRETLRDWFERFGLPRAIRVDNGGPWGRQQNTPSGLALWMVGLGIEVRWIRPKTPKDNPQIERANRLIDDWSEPHQCTSLTQWQQRLNHMIQRQRDEYPICWGRSRTQLHPDFYTVARPYQRQTESQHWDLAPIQRLLSQFVWQRVVSAKGQLTVMDHRFSVGSHYKHQTVQITYQRDDHAFLVKTLDGVTIGRHPAEQVSVEAIMSLSCSHRRRKRPPQTHVASV